MCGDDATPDEDEEDNGEASAAVVTQPSDAKKAAVCASREGGEGCGTADATGRDRRRRRTTTTRKGGGREGLTSSSIGEEPQSGERKLKVHDLRRGRMAGYLTQGRNCCCSGHGGGDGLAVAK